MASKFSRRDDSPPPVDPAVEALLLKISLQQPSADLFDNVAEKLAEAFKAGGSNRTTQIRRFYDELLRFQSKVKPKDTDFDRILPHIRMMNAKAAYSCERQLVDSNFKAFLRALLDQVKDRQTLDHACTLFEAVIGFSPRN